MEESPDKKKPNTLVEVKHHPLEDVGKDSEEDDEDEGFEVIEQDVKVLSEIDHEIEELQLQEDDNERTQSEGVERCQSETKEGDTTLCKRQIVEELFQLKSEFCHWTEIRESTIKHLREIADYIDTVSRRSAVCVGNNTIVLCKIRKRNFAIFV